MTFDRLSIHALAEAATALLCGLERLRGESLTQRAAQSLSVVEEAASRIAAITREMIDKAPEQSPGNAETPRAGK